MTLRRLSRLQWIGLLLGAAMFALAHLSGYSIALAECGPARASFGIDHKVWEGAALASAAFVVILAEAASVAVLLGTRETSYEAEPPPSRVRFFAIAASTANILFFSICVLDLLGEMFNVACRGA